jgi:proteic killer suppression protein
LAIKRYGIPVARKYVQRINLIKAAKNLEEVMQLPGLRCHPLKGNRKGEYAVKLTGFYRLIFTLEGSELNIAMIEEVSKHYDD